MGYAGFQATGTNEWRQKSKPKQILRASNKPKKSHAETQISSKDCTLFIELRGRYARALPLEHCYESSNCLIWMSKKIHTYIKPHKKILVKVSSLSISMRDDSWLGLRPHQLSRDKNLELIIWLFNRNTIFNQSGRVFSLGYFLILHLKRVY